MHRLTGNGMLLGIPVVLGVYILISFLISTPVFASGMSIFLLLSAIAALKRYAPTTYDILFKKLRSEHNDGSHVAIFGITIIALGSVYQGIYGVTWEAAGRPDDWVGTWYSRLGQLGVCVGFLSLYFSPDFTQGPPKIKNAVLVGALFIVSVLSAFLAGGKFFNSSIDDDVIRFFRIHGANRVSCSADMPVWGTAKRTYHTPNSPYRGMVIPKFCFKDEQQAIDAGFSAPGAGNSAASRQSHQSRSSEPLPSQP